MTNCIHIDNDGFKCVRKSVYNMKGLSPKYCKKHKKDVMVNVKSKCKKCFLKQPSFNYPGEELKADYCGDCKKEGMITKYEKNKRCIKCDEKYAGYNYPGQGLKKEYCRDCKKVGMVNLKQSNTTNIYITK